MEAIPSIIVVLIEIIVRVILPLMIVATLWSIPLLVWLVICRPAIRKWGDRARKARNVGIGIWLLLTVAAVGFSAWTGHRQSIDAELQPVVWKGYTYRANELLDRGGDPNGDCYGEYYLAIAAGRGDIRMVQLLLEHGADPNAISPGGSRVTALSVAKKNGNTEIVKLLKKAGARR